MKSSSGGIPGATSGSRGLNYNAKPNYSFDPNPLPSIYTSTPNQNEFLLRNEPSVYSQYQGQNLSHQSTQHHSLHQQNQPYNYKIQSSQGYMNQKDLSRVSESNKMNLRNTGISQIGEGMREDSLVSGYVSSSLNTTPMNNMENAHNGSFYSVQSREPGIGSINGLNSSFSTVYATEPMNSSVSGQYPNQPVPLPPGSPRQSFHRSFSGPNQDGHTENVSQSTGMRPNTASYQSMKRYSTNDVYINRVSSAKSYRIGSTNNIGGPFNPNSLMQSNRKGVDDGFTSRTVVPPNLSQSLSSVDMERLAGIIRMTSNALPNTSSKSKTMPHPQSATSRKSKNEIPLNFTSILKTTKKKKKKKISKSMQTMDDFENTNEILLRQNAELEKRLMHAENESMIWKARFHSFKTESDTLIAQLQKVNIGFKARIKQIQEKNTSLDALQREHERQIETLNDTHRSKIIMAQQSHKIALNNLRNEYEEKLKALEHRLNQALKQSQEDIQKSYQYAESLKVEHANEIKRLQAERDVEIEKLSISNYKQDKEVKDLNEKFKLQIDALHKKFQETTESERLNHKQILDEHIKANTMEQNKLHKDYERKLAEFKESYDQKVSELRKTYETELMELKYRYDDQIATQKSEHDAMYVSLKAEHESQIQQLKQSYEQIIAGISNQHKDEPSNEVSDYSNVVQNLMDVTEKKVHEYQEYINDLEALFNRAEKNALSSVASDEISRENIPENESTNPPPQKITSENRFTELQAFHRSLSLKILSLRSNNPNLHNLIESSLNERLMELEKNTTLTCRIIEDLQVFASNQDGTTKENTASTLSNVLSQYESLLQSLEIHVNILINKTTRWKESSTSISPSNIIKAVSNFTQNSSIDDVSHTPNSKDMEADRNLKKNQTLTLDTAIVLKSFTDFKIEDPLSNSDIDITALEEMLTMNDSNFERF